MLFSYANKLFVLCIYLSMQIEIDFEAIFGEVADTLFLKWTPSFAEKVMAYATRQVGRVTFMLTCRNSTLVSCDHKFI